MSRIAILLILLLALTAGCGPTTTDPRQGGLFSYNPEAYEQRLQQRRAEKQRLEQENQQLQKEQQDLEAQSDLTRAERARLRRQLGDMDQDLAMVEQKLARVKARTKQQKYKLWKAQTKLKNAKRRMAILEDHQSRASAKDQAEYERLRKRLDQLMDEAEALSDI
jgi:chromosome segregation ATPase